MATFTKLPSGKWRAQVRKAGIYKGATFSTKLEAKSWAASIEHHANHVAVSGYAPPPKGATLADLIEKYTLMAAGEAGKTKKATLKMLSVRLGQVKLSMLSAAVLRDFIDKRELDGAGGVTIAADLSFLSAVLKWARHSRRLDVHDRLALEARESLKHRGMNTRSAEREREPSDDELSALYSYWDGNARQKIDMSTLVRFGLATGMRLGEICQIRVDDVDREKHTVVIRDRKDPRLKKGNDQTVPLLPQAWEIVKPLIADRTSGKVFNVKASSASTAFTRACQKLEIHGLHFHDLRHKATADFFRCGLDIPHVALLTGHKTWAMLRRYTSIKAADVQSAFERVQGN
ncbi:tyrosine-type recombinase/integrase [Pseudomonas palmensis]|uniref:tyrosine-type recombinase/integrase n=1 Tax=Pseudomonas palmensis TaxID=2815362 RepID=UPI0039E8F255